MSSPLPIDPSEIRLSNPSATRANIMRAGLIFEERCRARAEAERRKQEEAKEAAAKAAARAAEMLKEAQQRVLAEAVMAAKNREAVSKYRLHYSQGCGEPADPADPESFPADPPMPRRRKVGEIIHEVALAHGLTIDQIKSPRRTGPLVSARMEAYYKIATERADISFPEIGRRLGGRDHTTVLHGVRVYAERNGLPPVVRS